MSGGGHPKHVAGIGVPQDRVSVATWRWAQSALPRYLVAHSVRSYCWGAEIADQEGWTFDRQILWTAALFHDLGLARLRTNTMCFEVESAEFARRSLVRLGMTASGAERAAIAIILHMQPNVTLGDGVESLLLDRATALDVRGVDVRSVARIRARVTGEFPRGSFDRLFMRAISREATARPTCQSAAFVKRANDAGWPRRTPWAEVG
jgi:hypothetical protein